MWHFLTTNGFDVQVIRKGKDRFSVEVWKDSNLVAVPKLLRGMFWQNSASFLGFKYYVREIVGSDAAVFDTHNLSLEMELAYRETKYNHRTKTYFNPAIDRSRKDSMHIVTQNSTQEPENVYDSARSAHAHSAHTKIQGLYVKSMSLIHTFSGRKDTFCYTMCTKLNEEINDEGESLFDWQPYMVTSERELIRCDNGELIPRGMFMPAIFRFQNNRWSLEDIDKFLSTTEEQIKREWVESDAQLPLGMSQEEYERVINLPKGLSLFDRIMLEYESYIDFVEGRGAAMTLAAATIGSYFFHLFNSFPYIYLHGVKASGKTKTCAIANQLAHNAVHSVNMSPASLFRLVSMTGSTVIIDEGETVNDKERSAALRELLLAGYKKGAKTYRVEESKKDFQAKTFDVKEFELFSPKWIANITGMEDILESRVITVVMQPTRNKTVADNDIVEMDPKWQTIRNDLYVCYMTCWKYIEKKYNDLENDGFFRNREWELWKPLLAIASFFGKEEQLREYAKKKVMEAREDNLIESHDITLMGLLYKNVKSDQFVQVKHVFEWFRDDLGFAPETDDFGREKYKKTPGWLNTKYVGNMLKRLGFREKRKVAAGIEIAFKLSQIVDTATRLGLVNEETDKEKKEQTTLQVAQAAQAEPKDVDVKEGKAVSW